MACQCGTSTDIRADESQAGACGCGSGPAEGEAAGCGCGSAPAANAPESLDVAALARLVKELDQRVRELEMETSRT